MKKSVSEFYREELNSWIDSILFYLIEINKMEDRLKEVISRDGIVDIAAKVEVYQLMLNKSRKFGLGDTKQPMKSAAMCIRKHHLKQSSV